MKKIKLAILIFVSIFSTISPSKKYKLQNKKLTIGKAVKNALLRKPTVLAYQYDVENYKHQRSTAITEYVPNITLSEKFHGRKKSSVTANIKRTFAINAQQTLFNLSSYNKYKQYSSLMSSAKHTKQAHQDEIRLSTQSAFLAAFLVQNKLNMMRLQFNSAKDTYEKSKNLFEQKLISNTDLLQAQSTYAESLASVDNYRSEIKEAEKIIEYYTGIKMSIVPDNSDTISKINKSPYMELAWNPKKEDKIKSFDHFYKKALNNRKDLKLKDDTIEKEKHTSQYYEKQYLPKVGVSLNYEKNSLRGGSKYTTRNTTLNISWNVFDGLTNYFNKEAAGARKMKAVLEKNDLRNKIKMEVQSAYTALKSAKNLLSAQEITFKHAKSNFKLKKQQFKQGLISQTDFKNAEFSFESSRIAWLTQAATTKTKYFELLSSCGYPSKS